MNGIEAFTVVCDETNNSAEDINTGQLRVDFSYEPMPMLVLIFTVKDDGSLEYTTQRKIT